MARSDSSLMPSLQRQIPLERVEQTELDGAEMHLLRDHWPILLARAVKKMPEGLRTGRLVRSARVALS